MICVVPVDDYFVQVDCSSSGSALIVVSRVEYESNTFNLTPESGMAIGGAILMVMSVAFVFRMIRKSLETLNDEES